MISYIKYFWPNIEKYNKYKARNTKIAQNLLIGGAMVLICDAWEVPVSMPKIAVN